MNEIDREIGLVLLKRLWQRNFISEDLYHSASHSRFFDRKHFTHYAEDKPLQVQEQKGFNGMMTIRKLREQLRMGRSIYDLSLRVTYYARVSTEKVEQQGSLENQVQYYTEHCRQLKASLVKSTNSNLN